MKGKTFIYGRVFFRDIKKVKKTRRVRKKGVCEERDPLNGEFGSWELH